MYFLILSLFRIDIPVSKQRRPLSAASDLGLSKDGTLLMHVVLNSIALEKMLRYVSIDGIIIFVIL